MDTINGEESSSKKKLIVPIIALMLCAVAVLGAGYAYTSSVAVNDNAVDGGQISVDVNGGTFLEDEIADAVFTQDKTYTANAAGTVTEGATTIKAQGYGDGPSGVTPDTGKAYSKLGNANIVINGKGVGTQVSLAVKVTLSTDATFGTTGQTLSTIVDKMVFYDGTELAFSVELKSEGSSATLADPLTISEGVDLEKTYTVYLLIKETTLTPGSSPSGDTPADYVTALENAKIAVEFTVSNVTA